MTLVTGPTHLTRAAGADVVQVRSAAEMHAAVMARAGGRDVDDHGGGGGGLHAGGAGAQKIKKSDGPLDDHAQPHQGHPRRARASCRRASSGCRCWSASRPKPRTSSPTRRTKLEHKGVDLIVANDVSRAGAGFDVDTNAVTLVSRDGTEEVPLQARPRWRPRILDRVEQFLVARSRDTNAPAKA